MTILEPRRYTVDDSGFRADLVRLAAWSPTSAVSVPKAQVVDFFSGAGGTSLGFANHPFGFEILAGFDIDEISATTFATNLGAECIVSDLGDLQVLDSIPDLVARLPRRDAKVPLITIGCPPCQGFSAHTRTRPSHVDERNGLVAKYAQLIVSLDVDIAVMENVPELLRGPFSHEFVAFRSIVEAAGYRVSARVLDASHYGTPQRRKRAIVIAERIPDGDPFDALPAQLPVATVREAISDLEPLSSGQRGSGIDEFHSAVNHQASTIEVIEAVPKNGGSRPPGIGPASLDRIKGFTDVYGRLRWDEPSVTITKYARNPASGRFVHPEQDRGLTAREASRLQGFPDGFAFTGPRGDVYRQIGEAVPPPLALAVAQVVASALYSVSNERPSQ